MDAQVLIVDDDADSRGVLEKALRKEGLGEICRVMPVAAAQAADGQACLRLVDGRTGPDAIAGNPACIDFTKPVRLGVLLAAIRRQAALANAPEDTLVFKDYRLDCLNHVLNHATYAQPVRLTEKESRILAMLIKHDGGVVSRKALLDDVWQYAEGIETHTLETHIYRLRQKIEKDPAKPEILLTDEAGYRLGTADGRG